MIGCLLYNLQLPEKLEIKWNKKMTKTAGYCITGLKKDESLLRYARIELSEKVCDSAGKKKTIYNWTNVPF